MDFQSIANSHGLNAKDEKFAMILDENDELKGMREMFSIPRVKDVASKVHDPSLSLHVNESIVSPTTLHMTSQEKAVYLCGNSLGLMPLRTKELVNQELDVWAERFALTNPMIKRTCCDTDVSGVHGHFHHKYNRPWVSVDVDNVVNANARIVGAKKEEVAIMNSLTVNLHLLMVSFYMPTPKRFKILMEGKAFPSDYHAIQSQLKFHGYDPKDALIEVFPRDGEECLRMEDILQSIAENGDSVSLILFSGVQYYTGQLFDIKTITEYGHRYGCMVGFDLAHAVGNVVLKLHEWCVDFAVWCTYKYMNAGPGSIGGAFIHESHHHDSKLRKLCGWWGHKPETRFQMLPEFDEIPGAAGYRMSNPSVLAVTALLGSLQVFEMTSMEKLSSKSQKLTGYLEYLLTQTFKEEIFKIVTPSRPEERGCQLSLFFRRNVKSIFVKLMEYGVVCDKREPNCIRVAPVPLYNNFHDVWRFVNALENAINKSAE